MRWLYLALLFAILRGGSYVLLGPISKQISPYVINTIYGLTMTLCNLAGVIITQNYRNLDIFQDSNILARFSVYILISVVSSIVYMYSYSTIEKSNINSYVTVSSIYPLFTFLFSYLFQNEEINTNIILGITLIIVGISILTLK